MTSRRVSTGRRSLVVGTIVTPRGGGLGERLVEIADDVVDALEADRKPQHVRPGAGGHLLLGAELAMRGRGRMDDQRAGVADVGEVREEIDGLDDLHARLVAALDADGEDRAGALRQVFLRQRAILVRGQPGIGDPGNLRMAVEILGDLLRVLDVALHAERQGLAAEDGEVGVHRRHGRPEVAEPDGVAIDGVGEVAEGLGESEAVIGRLRLAERGETIVLGPVEAA